MGSVELVVNFNAGAISAFASGGPAGGFMAGGTLGPTSGFIWGLGISNASYKGPFTSVNIGVSLISASLAANSKGYTNPFDLSKPIVATVGAQAPGVSFAWGETYYTNPFNLGNLNDTAFKLLLPDVYEYYQDYQKLCGGK